MHRPRRRSTPLAAAAALLLACGQASTVDAPAPIQVTGGVDSLPVLPPSLVDAPITYDVSPAIARLEATVPTKFGDLEARRRHPTNRRMNSAFAAERAPFQVRLDGSTVRVSTVLEYQGKGWYNAPLGGDMFGSCGLGATRPRAVVELATTLRVTPEWRLRGKSEMVRVAPFSDDKRDQCKVTVFKIDVTDRVITAARTELEKRLIALDEKIAGIDIRSPMERWWRVLQHPIRLSDSVWLVLQPRGVHMGPISGTGRTVSIDVGLTGEPRVITGPRPADGTAGLPRLERENDKHDQALHVLLEGELSYDLANSILRKNVVGKRIRRGARWVTIRDARLSGIGAGRVALAIKFDGAANGLVYLVGTPRYDADTRQLFVPDLAYDVSSADLLVRGLEFMRRGDVQTMLRTRARFPVADLVEQARQRLERGMNRNLGQNATLVAKVATGDVLAVRATTTGVIVRAAANGTARLEVNRIPALSRQ
ncbi:MAG TPA: DUF4403 family protein [Gemmatimonadaceae bacterium]|nr:DUF4403 family protein [Gemmatimonadaceae bacterium]